MLNKTYRTFLLIESFITIAGSLNVQKYPNAFLTQMEIVDAVLGNPVVLTCQFNHSLPTDEMLKVSWVKMPRQLLARGQMKITTNERISVIPKASENFLQLRLNPATTDDAGEYRCVYNHATGVRYKVVVLNIQVMPTVEIDPRGELELLEGDYAIVVCNASGSPVPQIRWWTLPLSILQDHYAQHGLVLDVADHVTVAFPNNNARSSVQRKSDVYLNLTPVYEIVSQHKPSIFLRNGRLIINAIDRSMTGWYFCEAHNSVEPSALDHSLLTVHYAPKVFLPKKEILLTPFRNVSLVCEFQAFPVASIEWLLEDRVLDTHPCYRRAFRGNVWCTGKFHRYLPLPLGLSLLETLVKEDDVRHGSDDLLNYEKLPRTYDDNSTMWMKDRFRNTRLIKPRHGMEHYGRLIQSILHVWVMGFRHFGRYKCRMKTKHGLAEGIILLRNKESFMLEALGIKENFDKGQEFFTMSVISTKPPYPAKLLPQKDLQLPFSFNWTANAATAINVMHRFYSISYLRSFCLIYFYVFTM